ncbi:winged helix-turn-helix domain-containing protein [Paenibacillus nasutitermitis]|uniref:Winged helix-turn-helix domain-containing protein n=1 Tax=Paenibacillus nasutitermitis TaxID=1652958 RepID=A0A916Z6W7_9BACL|nr:crosslink repair DNA glycosylase YcaQ family protein [Paenibacillus nasutitermitis]GGD78196.1 hypothetical protein GCM10010911_40270 [Paenibacillus nasutitermitis]
MIPIQTTKRTLRRFLLETQLLLKPRAERSAELGRQHVLDVIRQLECIQIDPVSAVGPNQHLALAARIAGYEQGLLSDLLRENEVFEYFANAACIIPMHHYPIFEPVRQHHRERTADHLVKIQSVVEQVLQKLESEGPLLAKSFESDERVHGYWDNTNAKTKATSHALNLLMDAAQIRIVGRTGNQRLFDVTRRSIPVELQQEAEQMDTSEALDQMMRKYFRAYRVFEPGDARLGWQRLSAKGRRDTIDRHVESGEVVPVLVEGLKQPYYILSSDRERLLAHQEEADILEDQENENEPVSFLPPLDNLLWSRKRLEDLFDFVYRWEIYTPIDKRKYGYYAMPILVGDRLIGRMDPRLDKKQKHLSVQLLQIDPGIGFTENLSINIHKELEAFASAHGAETVSVEHYSYGVPE